VSRTWTSNESDDKSVGKSTPRKACPPARGRSQGFRQVGHPCYSHQQTILYIIIGRLLVKAREREQFLSNFGAILMYLMILLRA
jgi:hypothetical protein